MVSAHQPNGRILAILGPTNTGKTHFAVERLLGHHSGVIGLPLRLLAREVYDKVAAIKGPRAVALVTGEEKIVPANPSYFVCTAESMPLGREFDFLAVDEIQLCADPERGHVFTDRLLHARGRHETLFMGSDTVRGLVQRLVPDAEYVSRPRLSSLSYAGPKKLSRLPRRSAIVAFSAADVYAVAELVRRQRGGAAVVMGALSPRTRNAQVAMYQAGEVDFLVATDAIGMGLNMAVEHIAFAGLRKFDGIGARSLSAAEIGQIAGRAGRYLNDGTFGTTADVQAMAPEIVEMVENHEFPRIKSLNWRNSDLSFGSIDALLRSLEAPPPVDCLNRPRELTDQMVLRSLASNEDIAHRARGRAAVRLFWQVCQIPDFRKTMPDAHARLLGRIYSQLMTTKSVLDSDWVAGHLAALDRTDGDIDTLANRIAHVRTWTFISHRQDWLDDAAAWQERARDLEDRLSDALHERLTQRFVDRRTAVLARRLRDRKELTATVEEDGEVAVEGHPIGTLRGFRFTADRSAAGTESRTLRAAAKRALGWEMTRRARQLCQSEDTAFDLEDGGRLLWQGTLVADLAATDNPLAPRLSLVADELPARSTLDKVRHRLEAWIDACVAHRMAPLIRLQKADLTGAARGIAYQLAEALGTCKRRDLNEQIRSLTRAQRQQLRRLGVRLGAQSVYIPAMLKPERAALCRQLWAIHRGLSKPPPVPAPGLVSFAADADVPDTYYQALGFRRFGDRAIRVDMVERLSETAHRLAKSGPFPVSPELLSLVGSRREEFPAIMQALGFRRQKSAESEVFSLAPTRKKNAAPRGQSKRKISSDSPFAALRELPTG